MAQPRAVDYNSRAMNQGKKIARFPCSIMLTSHPQIVVTLLASLLLLLLTACGEPGPTPFPTPADEPEVTQAPTSTMTAVPLQSYRNSGGAFSLQLPATWEVAPQGMTALGDYYQLGPEPVGPGPASSSLFVAEANELAAATAAELLLCGGGCADAVTLEATTVAGRPAARARLETEGTVLEWFFVEHGEQLIFFTLHDPETLATRTDLIETITFLEPAPTPTRSGSPTATPILTATAESPRPEWQSWQRVEAGAFGVTFEIPEGWEAQTAGSGLVWGPVAGSEVRVGFQQRPLAPDQSLQLLLPPAADVVATNPLTPTVAGVPEGAFYRGEAVLVQTEAGWEQHALFQIGLSAYDLYVGGPATGSLAALEPVLERALASMAPGELRLAFADPIAATVSWFQALIEDPAGSDARAYMSPALRQEVAANSSPVTLLNLGQRLVVYNLTWLSGTQTEAVVEAELTLLDESVVRRQITLIRDPLAGWQLDRVGPIPE